MPQPAPVSHPSLDPTCPKRGGAPLAGRCDSATNDVGTNPPGFMSTQKREVGGTKNKPNAGNQAEQAV
jgi:hypothetical protein